MRAQNIVFVIDDSTFYIKVTQEISLLKMNMQFSRVKDISKLKSSINNNNNCLIVAEFSTLFTNWYNKNSDTYSNIPIILLHSKKDKAEAKNFASSLFVCLIEKNNSSLVISVIKLLNKIYNDHFLNFADHECVDYIFKESRWFWDKLPIGLFVASPDGAINRVNKSFLKILGFTSLSLFNKINSTNDNKSNFTITKKVISEVQDRGGLNDVESVWIGKNGEKILLREIIALKSNKNEKILRLIGSIYKKDVNKSSKENSVYNREKLGNLLDLFTDSLIITDKKGNLKAFNKASEKLFGYSSDEMKNMNLSEFLFFDNKDDFEKILEVFTNKNLSVFENTPFGFEAKKKDQSVVSIIVTFSNWTIDKEIYFSLFIRPLSDNEQTINNFKPELALFTKLTKSYEKELIKSNNLLNNYSAEPVNIDFINQQSSEKSKVNMRSTDFKKLNFTRFEAEADNTHTKKELFSCKLNDLKLQNEPVLFNDEFTDALEIKQKQKIIIEILKEFNSDKDFSVSLKETLNILNRFFNFDALSIFMLENESLVCKASLGFDEEISDLSYLKNKHVVNSCLCGQILNSQNPIEGFNFTPFGSFYVNDIAKVPDISFGCLFSKGKQSIRCDNFSSIAIIPLSINKKVIGLLRFFSKVKNAFNKEAIQFFEEISSIYSIVYKKNENQANLEKREKQFKQLYNNSTACLFRADLKGNILLANPSFVSLLGFDSCEQLKAHASLVSLHCEEKDWEVFTKFLFTKGRVSDFSANWKRIDGSILVVLESAQIIYDNNNEPIYYEGTVQDITKRKISERKLAESERQFRLIWQNSMDAMRLLDENGYIIEVNDAFCSLVEKSRNELIGKFYFELYLNSDSLDNFKKFLSQSENQIHYEKEIVLWNGKSKWVSVSNSLFNLSDNNRLLLSVYRDISVSKEQELDLKFIYNKVEESNRIKTEFLSQMSHEIRTPVNVLVSISRMMEEEIETSQNAKLNSFIKTVKSETTRIVRTFDTILNYAEINSGGYNPTFVELSLVEDIVKKSFEKHLGAMNDKNLDFIFNHESDRSIITGDKYSLFYIFDQLFDNAVKFTLRGRISISVLEEDDKLLAIIEDTGIGISEEYLDNLFKPFSQEDRGYSRKFDGSGLGLALVKKYCELNNIDINIYSIKNIGTTIILQFNSTINTEVFV